MQRISSRPSHKRYLPVTKAGKNRTVCRDENLLGHRVVLQSGDVVEFVY